MPNAAVGTSLAQTTLAYLQGKISSGEWPVNSRIPTEPELMELIGVGRTTVREAVRSLANLGMLETLVSRGTFVRSRMPVSSVLADFIAHHALADLLGTRRALEVEGARLAALHATPALREALVAAHDADLPGRAACAGPGAGAERGRTPGQFHSVLLEASGNTLLAELYAGILVGVRAATDRGDLVHGASAEQRRADHGAVLDAVLRGDADGAAAAMAAHADRDLVPAVPAKG
jgi:DNA-binding FadR family transcriptional regulator